MVQLLSAVVPTSSHIVFIWLTFSDLVIFCSKGMIRSRSNMLYTMRVPVEGEIINMYDVFEM